MFVCGDFLIFFFNFFYNKNTLKVRNKMNKKNIIVLVLTCGVVCQDAGAAWVYQGARVTNNTIPLMAQRIVNQEKKPRKPGQPPLWLEQLFASGDAPLSKARLVFVPCPDPSQKDRCCDAIHRIQSVTCAP
jgi:hypothetical protein